MVCEWEGELVNGVIAVLSFPFRLSAQLSATTDRSPPFLHGEINAKHNLPLIGIYSPARPPSRARSPPP